MKLRALDRFGWHGVFLLAAACSCSDGVGGSSEPPPAAAGQADGRAGQSGGAAPAGGGAGGVFALGGAGGAPARDGTGGGPARGGTGGGSSGAGSSAAGTHAAGGAGGAPARGGTAGVGASGESGGGSTGATATGGRSAGGRAGTSATPACADNQVAHCTGTSSIECHFGGTPGDYAVTLELGGVEAGDMVVEAESFRRVLGHTLTSAGHTERFSLLVNVREPEGQPIQDVPAGTPGLDLYVRGTKPELAAVCFERVTSAPKLWIAGDSTVCDQDTLDYAGWGQHLPQYFLLPVSVANYADSGESSGSFLGSSKLWGAIKAGWKAGDFVLIQLGHNDKDVAAATFQSNMTAFVTQAKAAGVNPILVTPTSRVGYALADEHVNSTGANLPQIIRDLAQSEGVPVIDLTVTTWNWLQTVDFTAYYALGTDHTHTNPQGAEVIAGFVRDAIVAQALPLAPYLR